MVSPFLKQCFVVMGAAMSQMGHGAAYGYTAVLVAHYTDDRGNKMSNDDLSWIGSVFAISKLCGCFLTPPTMSMFGRQKAHLITILPILVHWLLFVFGRSLSVFITARLLLGISAGMYSAMNSMMIAEYTDPVNRGAFSSISSLAIGFGVIWVHVWGTVISWRTTAAVTTAIPIITAIFTWFSPETPSWLVSKQRYEEATRVFIWLRGDSPRQRKEIEELIENDKLKQEASDNNLSAAESRLVVRRLKQMRKCLLTKEFYHPIFILFIIVILVEFIGAHYMAAYGNMILKALLNKKEPKEVSWYLNFLDIVRPVATILSIVIVKKFNRRKILITSVLMAVLSLSLLSVYVYIRSAYGFGQTRILDIFVMTLMTLYTISHYLGVSPIFYVIFGEILPLQYRGIGSSIAICNLSVFTFIVLKTCPQMYSSIGVEGSFVVYSVIIVFCLIILYYILPETKDRTLLDIESEFRNKKETLKSEKTDPEVELRLMNTNTMTC